ncbi:hypothetical protein RN001_002122 [Aquatica leii]|uniref:Uncharacterized protein n=1 Tax=Aquatica leii TaxID=1421715 RepID=A0AAN7PM00_9COLE|nr:hypothetical protein RN001_002122 [Aquatica leii]
MLQPVEEETITSTPVATSSKVTFNKKFQKSRGAAVEAELQFRLRRLKLLIKQDAELHEIALQEKNVRLRIAEEELRMLQNK